MPHNAEHTENGPNGDEEITDDSNNGLTKDEVELDTKNRVRRYAKKRRGGILRYPLESLTEHTDYLQIDIEEYVPVGDGYVSDPGSGNRYVTGNIFTTKFYINN